MRTVIRLLAVVLAAGFAFPTPAAETKAAIKVQVDRPGIKVSPTLWGIFYEEINCSGDGGLYAELVRNRSFEDADRPEGWTGVADARISIVDALGREVTGFMPVPQGTGSRRTVRIATSNMLAGIYWCRVISPDGVEARRLVVLR